MKSYQALLAKNELPKSERDLFVVKLERATKQHAAWDERRQALVEMVASIEARVKDVCASMDIIRTRPNRHCANLQ
jgi:hypothetical protein